MACSHVMKPASTALVATLRSGWERGVTSATLTLLFSIGDYKDYCVSTQAGYWRQGARQRGNQAILSSKTERSVKVMCTCSARPSLPTYAMIAALQLTCRHLHLVPEDCHFGLELLDAQHIFILDSVIVLTGRAISVASLTRAISITPYLGCATTDTGVDSAAFAWSW